MTDAGDEQSYAEFLDDDKLTEEYPPDEPLGVDEYGVTAGEETVPESLAERIQREEPDFGEVGDGQGGDDEVGTLVHADQGQPPDLEDQEVAQEVATRSAANTDPDDIAFGDDTLRDVAQERIPGGEVAEEAAMHLTEDPPMGTAEPGSADVGDYVAIEDVDDDVAASVDEAGEVLGDEEADRGA